MRLDLLLMQFVLLNAVIVALGFAGQDYLIEVWLDDTTYISEAIVGVLTFGWLLCLWRVYCCSRWIDTGHKTTVETLDGYARPIDYLSYLCVSLGFFGTVVGFRISLLSIDEGSVGSVEVISQLIGGLVSGMGVALATTILGIIGYAILSLNLALLDSGHSRLLRRAKHDTS